MILNNSFLKKIQKFKNFQKFDKKRLIFAAGRLTKQKNFSYLIDEFSTFLKNNKVLLLILGDGEERNKLEKKIIKKKLQTNVYLIGHWKCF